MGTVELLRTRRELDGVVAGWRTLAEAHGNAFVTPEWYLAWLDSYGERAEPAVIAQRDGDRVRGLLSFVSGPDGVRFGGANLGDHFEPLADRSVNAVTLAQAAGEALRAAGLGRVVLENVARGAEWPTALAGGGERVVRIPHRDDVMTWIPLSGRSWEEYLASRSRNLRSQLGRRLRALEQVGEVRFRLSEGAEVGADLERFFELHEARWAARDGSQAITERSRAFHRRFAAAAAERGWLRLWMLELDGEAISAWYGWRVSERYAYYLAGWDERFSRYTPGQLLLAHTIRAAFDEGAGEYDLLLGGEPYKLRFAERSRSVESLAIVRPWSRHAAVLAGERWARAAASRLAPGTREALKSAFGRWARHAPGRVER